MQLRYEEKLALLAGCSLGVAMIALLWLESTLVELTRTENALWAVSKRNRRLVEVIDAAAGSGQESVVTVQVD